MTDQPKITVTKVSHLVNVQLTGLDEQGRQLYRCPNRGCGDEAAYFDEEGYGHCPSCEPFADRVRDLLREAYERLMGETT